MDSSLFLSSMAHEIRTPLNGIVGYAQLLSQTRLNQNQTDYVNQMNRCCVQLIELINDMLDYSSILSGHAKINKNVMNVSEFIFNIKSATEYKITEKKQRLHFELSEEVPSYLITDQKKITQIVINLVNNACKYTPEGGRIIVSLNKGQSHQNILSISVEDNGIGISKEDMLKLFQPFCQLKPNTTGNGLGLFISKKLTTLLEGDIKVNSEIGSGSIFTINIKYEDINEYEKYIDEHIDTIKGKYVLIVDENIENRMNLTELLFEYSLKPIISASPKECLKLIEGKHYEFICVFADAKMVHKNIPISKAIKNIREDIPIYGLSFENILEPTYTKIILKPFHRVKILEVLSDLAKKYMGNSIILHQKSVSSVPSSLKILIAEDVQYNVDVIIKILNSLGYTNIISVSDGKEAIENLKNIDILFLDLKMPIMDGFGVANFIRDNSLKTIIVVITASIMDEDRKKCDELGIHYFIQKPLSISAIRNVMDIILKGRSIV